MGLAIKAKAKFDQLSIRTILPNPNQLSQMKLKSLHSNEEQIL